MNNNITRLFNILLSDKPSEEIIKNEEFIFSIIPDLKTCKGFEHNNKWHMYDVYNHILHVIDGVPNIISLRLSALFHDIGKPSSYFEDEDKIGHFHGHWIKSQEIFLNFSKDYNLDINLTNTVSKLVYYHDINISKLDEEQIIKLVNELSIDEIKELFLLKKSDLLAHSKLAYSKLDEYLLEEEKLLNRLK